MLRFLYYFDTFYNSRKKEGKDIRWCIFDDGETCGIFLNGSLCKPEVEYPLNTQDIIGFGTEQLMGSRDETNPTFVFQVDSPASVRELYVRYGVLEEVYGSNNNNSQHEVSSSAEKKDGKKKVDVEDISNTRMESSIVLEEVNDFSDIDSEESFDTNPDTPLEPTKSKEILINEIQDLSEFENEEPQGEISESKSNIPVEAPAAGTETSQEAEAENQDSQEAEAEAVTVDEDIEFLKIVSVEALEVNQVKVEQPSPSCGSQHSDASLDCVSPVPSWKKKKSLECPHCPKKFSKARKYSSHLARRHGDYPVTSQTSLGLKLKTWKCRKCEVETRFSSPLLLYTHYSNRHYQEELQDKLGLTVTDGFCPLACGTARKKTLPDLLAHLGSEHAWVEEFMPAGWRVGTKPDRPEEREAAESETSPGSESELSEWSTTSSSRGTPRLQSISSPSVAPPPVNLTDPESLLYQREFTITSDTLCAVPKCGFEGRCRAGLYEHYSSVHFKAELCQMMGYAKPTECPLCDFKGSMVVRHYGAVHKMVEPFIPSFRLHRCDVRIKKIQVETPGATKEKKEPWTCQLCSAQPFSKRRAFLEHLAGVHFKEELKQKLGSAACRECPECGKEMKTTEMVRHVGVTHNYLEQIIPGAEILGRNDKRKRVSREDDNFEYWSPKKSSKKMKRSDSAEEKKEELWRCDLCKAQPFFNKSRLQYHQSLVHYKEKLLEMLDDHTRCPECQKTMTPTDLVRHVGVAHKYLERFILKPPAEKSQGDGKTEESKKRLFIDAEDDDDCKEDINLLSPGKRIQLTHQHKYLDTEDTAPTYLCHLCYSQNDKIKTFQFKGKLYEHYSTVHYRTELEEMFGISKADTFCPDCGQTKLRLVTHLGVTHNHVERFLPRQYHANTTTKQAVTEVLEEMIESATLTNPGNHDAVRPIIDQILEKVFNH